MIELPPPAELMKLADQYGYACHERAGLPDGSPDTIAARAALESAVRAYGEACARAAIEAAAGICDRFAEREMHPAECAGAIRRMGATRIGPFAATVDPTMPPNEVRFVQDGKIVGVLLVDDPELIAPSSPSSSQTRS
jgi:hypothetical protein